MSTGISAAMLMGLKVFDNYVGFIFATPIGCFH